MLSFSNARLVKRGVKCGLCLSMLGLSEIDPDTTCCIWKLRPKATNHTVSAESALVCIICNSEVLLKNGELQKNKGKPLRKSLLILLHFFVRKKSIKIPLKPLNRCSKLFKNWHKFCCILNNGHGPLLQLHSVPTTKYEIARTRRGCGYFI